MIGFRGHFQHLQFDVGAHRSKDMVTLCGDRFGRRLRQRRILFERFVIGFHVPSFAIDCGDTVVSKFEVTGDQIESTGAAISVYEDLLDQMKGKIHPLQINGRDGILLQDQRIDTYILTILFIIQAQGHLAIGLQRHDEITLKLMFDKHHVLGGSKPDIIQHITEGNLVAHDLSQQLLVDFILRDWRPSFFFACLFVDVVFGFLDQMIVNRQRDLIGMIQGCDEVNAFDRASLTMIPMPTDDVVFIGIGFFREAIIHDQYTSITFHLPDIWFDHLPEVTPTFDRTCQEALNTIMTDRALQQARQSRTCGQSKRTDQVVCINIEQFFIVHNDSLHQFETLCA